MLSDAPLSIKLLVAALIISFGLGTVIFAQKNKFVLPFSLTVLGINFSLSYYLNNANSRAGQYVSDGQLLFCGLILISGGLYGFYTGFKNKNAKH